MGRVGASPRLELDTSAPELYAAITQRASFIETAVEQPPRAGRAGLAERGRSVHRATVASPGGDAREAQTLGAAVARPAHPVGGHRRADHGRGLSQDGDELGWPRLAASDRRTAGAALALRGHRAVGFGRAPEAVVAIQPERITDGELRAYAVEQRAQHPRWLRLGEVAQRYHVTSGTVAGWVAQGRFAAEQVQRYGVLWLREDALHGFVAPCDQRWVRTACCRRRVPIGHGTPPTAVLICQTCWSDVRVLPGGHLLRLVPPSHVGLPSVEASDQRRRSGGPHEPCDHRSAVRPP